MNNVSLEVAQKLKKAGWIKEDDMHGGKYFYKDKSSDNWEYLRCYWCLEERSNVDEYDFLPAPQLHEILEELPAHIDLEECYSIYVLTLEKDDNEWLISYDGHCDTDEEVFYSKNPHDAAALLWIYLKENNLLNVSTS